MKKVVYRRPTDAVIFDFERFYNSLSEYGKVNRRDLQRELDKMNYNPIHVSVLVELGVKMLTNDEAAAKYYNDHLVWLQGAEGFERLRRITGYLVGSLERWNDAKKAEESERIKHGL